MLEVDRHGDWHQRPDEGADVGAVRADHDVRLVIPHAGARGQAFDPLQTFAPRSPAAVAFQQLWEETERLP
jgi:hypothetical protein